MSQSRAYQVKGKQVVPFKNPSPKYAPAIYRRESSKKDTFDEVADMARSGYRLARKLADLVNIEHKCLFYNQTAANPVPGIQTLSQNWSTMTPVTLNVNEAGDLDFQRCGDSFKIQHLDFYLTPNQSTSATMLPSYRLIIFWDETNSSNTTADLIEAAFISTVMTQKMTKDWDNKASTKILFDESFAPVATEYYAPNFAWHTKHFAHHRISFPIDKHTQFEAGTTTIVTGALKFIIITDNTATSTFFWQARMLYTDD